MAKPRIIIADSDVNYVIPMQAKFAEDFFENADSFILEGEGSFLYCFASSREVSRIYVWEISARGRRLR